jgi:hypothetical protein
MQGPTANALSHLETNAVLGLRLEQNIRVDYVSPKARDLVGARTDADMQAILESKNFFSALRQKL